MPKNISSDKLIPLISPQSEDIRRKVEKIAKLDTIVLFSGETGTGKDFWAEYLSVCGESSAFINLNCGDVTPSLLESEWFGYEKGAFTGADRSYEGRWASAGDGVLFINQIDLLDPAIQSRFLRVIERKKYYPVGGLKEVDVEARFVFSATDNIEALVEKGLFRRDLYYRISVYQIHIPPLRDRREEILPFVRHFAEDADIELSISDRCSELLQNYTWPGNIREIGNFVHGCGVMKSAVTDEDVMKFLTGKKGFVSTFYRKEPTMRELTEEYAEYMVGKYRNKSLAAEKMGVSRKTLYNILNKK